jgi:hypothetical protein
MARSAPGSSIRAMSLHARNSSHRIRLVLAAAAILAFAGCGSRDATAGQPRNITPSMSETHGNTMLFNESKSYVWADDRY